MSKQSEPMRGPDSGAPGLLRSASLNKERHDWQERRTTRELPRVASLWEVRHQEARRKERKTRTRTRRGREHSALCDEGERCAKKGGETGSGGEIWGGS